MKSKILYLLLILTIAISLFVPFATPAFATTETTTFTGTTSDGELWKQSGVSYAAARDSATALVYNTQDYIAVGQSVDVGITTYDVRRGLIYFTTTAIPDTATVTSAYIKLRGDSSNIDTVFDLVATSGMPTYPHDPLVAGDFNRTNYGTTNLGSMSSSGWSDSGWNIITLNLYGLAAINLTGTTKFMLRTSHDINNQIFTYDNWMEFYTGETAYAPQLVVTYSYPVNPTVTTSAATSVAQTSAVLNGSLSSMGDDSYTYVRFNYGISSGSLTSHTSYQLKTVTGAFADTIIGLTAGTIYYFQAEGYNSAGYAYGSIMSFTTTVSTTAPTVTTYLSDSETETTMRLVGYLNDDGGAVCSVRFQYGLTGAYEIGYTALQTGFSDGNYFYATLTGLNKGDLYYFRAEATNSVGTDTDAGLTELTYPSSPTAFTVTPAGTQNTLAWSKTSDIQKTLIRYSTTTYPINTSDGTQAYFDTGTSYVHTPLVNGTTYYYTVWGYATEGGETKYSYNTTGGYGTPYASTTATVSTLAATAVTTSSATLNGRLSSLGGYATVVVSFQYYTGTGTWTDHETTPVTKSATCDFSADVSGLSAATLYHFRVKATNGAGTVYGADTTFTTGSNSAPTMTTGAATSITKASAQLHGTVTSDGGASVAAYFEWGTTTAYGSTSTTVSGLITGSMPSMNLDELIPGTTYHYRIVGTNSVGTAYGSDVTFTTLSPDLPTVSTQSATDVGSGSALLRGVLQIDGGITCEVQFQYYAQGGSWATATSTGWQTGKVSGDSFSYSLSGLTIGYTYTFRAQAKNTTGTANGDTKTFTTTFVVPINFDATAISSTAINITWGKGGDQTYICMGTTAYPALRTEGTNIYYGTGTTYSLSGLSAGHTYYFTAWSWGDTGGAGTWATGYSTTMATTQAAPSIPVVTPNIPNPVGGGSWYTAPDYTKMSGMPLYSQINDLAASLSVPYSTFWLLIGILLSIVIGSIGLFLMQSLAAGAIFLIVAMVGGYFFGMIPLWMAILTAIAGLSVVILDRRGVIA